MGIIIICIYLAIYFIPTIVASGRDHEKEQSIFVINLFLGWTLLGWVICLAWAVGGGKTTSNRETML